MRTACALTVPTATSLYVVRVGSRSVAQDSHVQRDTRLEPVQGMPCLLRTHSLINGCKLAV